MIRVSLMAAFILLAFAAPKKTVDSHVLQLTTENFDETLGNHPMTLVMFYDPNTQDYPKLQVEYASAALQLGEQNATEVFVAKANIMKNKELVEKFGFSEFPIIILFDGSDQLEYEGEKTATALVDWIKLILSQPYRVIETAEELEREVQVEELAKIFFYGDTGSEQFKTFERIAHLDRDNEYFVVSKPELRKDIWTPTVRVHASFHHPQAWATYSGDWTKDNLMEWIQDESLPVIIEMGERTMKYIFDDKVTTLLLVNYGEDAETALGVIENHCVKNKNFSCGQLSRDNPMFEAFTSFLAEDGELKNSELLLLQTKSLKMYRYKKPLPNITTKLLDEWLGEWQAGKLVQDNLGEEHAP